MWITTSEALLYLPQLALSRLMLAPVFAAYSSCSDDCHSTRRERAGAAKIQRRIQHAAGAVGGGGKAIIIVINRRQDVQPTNNLLASWLVDCGFAGLCGGS